MSGYHLAELNVGRLLAPVGAPEIRDFVDNLGRINALADGAPGFVWRLTGAGDDATDLNPFPDPSIAVNMSVWTGIEPLAAFVYRSAHRDIMRRRREWFHAMELYMVLWWVPAGHIPTTSEAWAKLKQFEADGPTAEAFSFRVPFPAPDAFAPEQPVLDECA